MIDIESVRRLATTAPAEIGRQMMAMADEIEVLREKHDRALLDGASQMRDRAAACVQRAREQGETDHRSMLAWIRGLTLVPSPGETDFDESDL